MRLTKQFAPAQAIALMSSRLLAKRSTLAAARGREPAALGRMIVRLGRSHGIRVINVVRRPEQVRMLRAVEAGQVLDSSEGNFVSRLRELAVQRHPRVRCCQRATTVGPTDAMPFGSTIVAYGALAGEPSAFSARTLIAENRKIIAFFLGSFKPGRSAALTTGAGIEV
jgi:NADPH2:quinone reductase